MIREIKYSSLSRLLATGLAMLAVAALFIGMISDYLVALLLAAIFSAMIAPLFARVKSFTGDRDTIAALLTLLIVIMGVLLPLLLLVILAADQAASLSHTFGNFVKTMDVKNFQLPIPDWMPFADKLRSLGSQAAGKAGDLAGQLATLFVSAASAATKGTASFFLNLFVMIYALFFFLQEKTNVLAQVLRFVGVSETMQEEIVQKILAVSQATLKGTLVIGFVQGCLGGIGFAFAGISGAVFWGAIMAVASVIPSVGTMIVWIPAVIYLAVAGDVMTAVLLAVWCAVAVGSVDNVLRPSLVGKGAQMSDLLVLVSTLGGLSMFGVVGLIIGPVIAGVFLTLAGVYHETLVSAQSEQSSEDETG